MALKKGMKAPTFSVSDQDGNLVSLSDFLGKKVVLYFYPKDNTPTCTEQACNLRDNIAQLKKAGITVLGISVDSVRKHKNFEQKFSLPFPLLADENHKIVNDYGVWGEKKLYGRVYLGIYRTTFLIDETGKIFDIITDVKANNHAQQILDCWEN
ncbi:MAG: thioredoxin-dependent thiol peroxidase [Bacteroidetes bacterium]|nr:thioredoxin-dependent thiol peroxidase [Bacteroidota bacterium]MBS1740869.1 thioredoxin-dependent thiol peroxidase [Bacteroidota bacterium]